MNETERLLSVGYSNHTLERFLALLRDARVTALADVRSSPFSRYNPHTNGPQLATELRSVGIAYVFLGEQLGGRPAPRELYDEDRVDYERVRQTAFFREGLDRLIRGCDLHVVAMMCGEEDPLDCHRGLMITPALGEVGIFPGHLRRDGRIETTPEMEQRLLSLTKVGEGLVDGLFAEQLDAEDQRALLAEAYRRRAKKIAFKLEETEEDY
jgi:uncharacterized protein (DUF488 family)